MHTSLMPTRQQTKSFRRFSHMTCLPVPLFLFPTVGFCPTSLPRSNRCTPSFPIRWVFWALTTTTGRGYLCQPFQLSYSLPSKKAPRPPRCSSTIFADGLRIRPKQPCLVRSSGAVPPSHKIAVFACKNLYSTTQNVPIHYLNKSLWSSHTCTDQRLHYFSLFQSGYISKILHKKSFNRFTLIIFIAIINISIVVERKLKNARFHQNLTIQMCLFLLLQA